MVDGPLRVLVVIHIHGNIITHQRHNGLNLIMVHQVLISDHGITIQQMVSIQLTMLMLDYELLIVMV